MLVLLMGGAPSVVAADGAAPGRYAILIGNDAYPGFELSASSANLEAVQRWLRDEAGYAEEEIHLLRNATRAQFLTQFDQALAAIPADGPKAKQIFFYFSGHGTIRPDEDGDELQQVGAHGAGAGDFIDEAFVMIPTGPAAGAPLKPSQYAEEDLVRDDEFFLQMCALTGRCDELVVVVEAGRVGGAGASADGPQTNMAPGGFLEAPRDADPRRKSATDGQAVDLRRTRFDDSCTLLFFAASAALRTDAASKNAAAGGVSGSSPDGSASRFTSEMLSLLRQPDVTWRALCEALESSDDQPGNTATAVALHGNLQRDDFLVREELLGRGEAASPRGFEAFEWRVQNRRGNRSPLDLEADRLPPGTRPELCLTPRSGLLYLYVVDAGPVSPEPGAPFEPRLLSAWPEAEDGARTLRTERIALLPGPTPHRIEVLGSPYRLPALNARRLLALAGAERIHPAPASPTTVDEDRRRTVEDLLDEWMFLQSDTVAENLWAVVANVDPAAAKAASTQLEFRERDELVDRRLALVVAGAGGEAGTAGAFPPVRVRFVLPAAPGDSANREPSNEEPAATD
ncbi:caspase family protein [Alienimonas californiensis]|uniref:caspase family protein n=1 Tax=Alienimonas californiensis TaxID=2527989 RepID=UPI001A9805A9|nr:caspase family protein [Alienimonas californiensis]